MEKKLKLSQTNKVLAGVCGGLGEYLNIDPTVVRVIYAVVTLLTALFPMIAIYLILWLVMR
jgi:phage shock protein C